MLADLGFSSLHLCLISLVICHSNFLLSWPPSSLPTDWMHWQGWSDQLLPGWWQLLQHASFMLHRLQPSLLPKRAVWLAPCLYSAQEHVPAPVRAGVHPPESALSPFRLPSMLGSGLYQGPFSQPTVLRLFCSSCSYNQAWCSAGYCWQILFLQAFTPGPVAS